MTSNPPTGDDDGAVEDAADADAAGDGAAWAATTSRSATGQWPAGTSASLLGAIPQWQRAWATSPQVRATLEAARKTIAATHTTAAWSGDVAAGLNRLIDPDGDLTRRMREVIVPSLNRLLSNQPQMQAFRETMAAFWRSWSEQVRLIPFDFWERAFPPNLRGLDDLSIDALQALAADAITVYYAPRPAIAARLLRAETTVQRRQILGRDLERIATDCNTALDDFTAPELAETVSFTRKAIAAIHDGHPETAQALLCSALDGALWTVYGRQGRIIYTSHNPKVTTIADLEEWDLRTFMVMAPIWHSYEHFDPASTSGLIPRTFARNATAHRVSRRQYNRRNTAQVLLLVTAFCAYVDAGAHQTLR